MVKCLTLLLSTGFKGQKLLFAFEKPAQATQILLKSIPAQKLPRQISVGASIYIHISIDSRALFVLLSCFVKTLLRAF